MTNKLYKDIVLEVDIDAKKGAKNQAKETQATFYSYDIQSGLVKINIAEDGQPLALSNGTEVLINVVKLGLPQQKLVYNADIVDATKGITHWDIPEYLTGYKGKVRAGVFINLPNGQRLHGGYFKFNMGISEIDTNLEELEEDYWQAWDEFQSEAEAEWSDWKAIRDDNWEKQEKDYDEWKKDQEEKQNNFENDYAKHWDNWKTQQRNKQSEFEKDYDTWKSTQEGKQTTFENDFSDWKTTQENKQYDFETNTNEIHENINKDIDDIEQRVNETNESLEDLDTYNRQQIDTKLDDKANESSIEEIKNAVEHGFITLEKGFENYNNSNTESDKAGHLQYVKVGPLCHIFGTVKNLSTIKYGGEIVVANIPLTVKTMDRTIGQGSSNDIFTCTAYASPQSFGNQITITRTRDGSGNSTDFTSGKWLNVSLTIRV
ncbi:hypothetical protein GCM10025886_20270 [Tetragenococcus halophilus subsp. flandriensis]|nr:BppU family phage baseplate upper protein [Tetragenococcus halophilus]GBD64868.1 hypothetical protein TEHD23766T_2295 [Tetragenococcus halophilus subsp. flandriensis]GMA08876.1 hypothetical protein GCM10025886_20270 [Tetragenococcus halophilus subsp. flandriensis]